MPTEVPTLSVFAEEIAKTCSQIDGLPCTQSDAEHIHVLLKATMTMRKRNHKQYHDLWKDHGWRGMLIALKGKVERAWNQMWFDSNISDHSQDSLIDLINYSVFCHRCAAKSNEHGKWDYGKISPREQPDS